MVDMYMSSWEHLTDEFKRMDLLLKLYMLSDGQTENENNDSNSYISNAPAVDEIYSLLNGNGYEQYDKGLIEKLISGFIGGKGGSKGGGDFFGTLKSAIHTRLMRFGEANLLKKGTSLAKKGLQKGKDLAVAGAKKGKEVVKSGAEKIKGFILGDKKPFKLGSEKHNLWVEQRGTQNVVLMASTVKDFSLQIEEFKGKVPNLSKDKQKSVIILIKKLEQSNNALKVVKDEKQCNSELNTATSLASDIQKALAGVSEVKRMETVIEIPAFNVKPKFSSDAYLKEEYIKQLKGQEDGLNRLSISMFLANRQSYMDKLQKEKDEGKKNPSGRDPKGNTQQEVVRKEAIRRKSQELEKQPLSREEANIAAREWMKNQNNKGSTKKEKDDILKTKINELTKHPLSKKEAADIAKEWISTQAALHDPYQIAGGDPENVMEMGNARINYSIGSQWKTRVNDLQKGVDTYVKNKNLTSDDKKIFI